MRNIYVEIEISLSRKTETNLYIDCLCPIVMYACEIRARTKGKKLKKLLIFERKILRKVYGFVLNSKSRSYKKKRKTKGTKKMFKT